MNRPIVRLMLGFRHFREKYFLNEDPEHSIYHQLASGGQAPRTLLIGCSDSRVDPAILFDASPGELFVVRNVANLVPPCEPSFAGFHGTSSAIEFAVKNLKVENVIVLGHRQCGGIQALIRQDADQAESFIGQWMNIAEDARRAVVVGHPGSDFDTLCRLAEMESIKVSLKNLKTFPFVQDALKAGQVNLIGVYFDLEQGQLWELDEATNQFKQLPL